MALYADLVAYDPNGQIVLIVESKIGTGTARAWATEMRRNLIAHAAIPDVPYLLFAFPDRFFLWKNVGIAPEFIEPTYEIDAYPLLQRYYKKMHISPEEILPNSFELLITAWVSELSTWGISEELPEETKVQLQDSGLREALRHAKIVVQVPA